MVELIAAGIGLVVILASVALVRIKPPPRELPPGAGPADRIENVRRLLKHLKRASIADLTDNAAGVLVGTVSGEPLLRAPLSGAPCLGYHVSVRAADNLGYPLVFDDARCGDFALADATGEARVRGDGLELAITTGPMQRYERPFPGWLRPMVPGWVLLADVREGLLLPGANALVCGVASAALVADTYRDGERVALELQNTPTFPLVASTDPDLVRQGDRPIDPQELPR